MKILFCIHDFKVTNYKLQPWLTVFRIGRSLANWGNQVYVITDHPTSGESDGLQIHSVRSLRGTNSNQICRIISSIDPDVAVISVSPLNLVTSRWFSALDTIKSFAFISYPFYNFSEISKAFFYLNQNDRWSYGRHLLVPQIFWRHKFSKFFIGAFCQSERTGRRINEMKNGKNKIHCILPGVDKAAWYPGKKQQSNSKETVFLYAGSPKRIRGFNLIIDAFSRSSSQKMKLKVLARGAEVKDIAKINDYLQRRKLKGEVEVIGGWMSAEDLRQQIVDADAVLLPFILVPSELPVTVMQAIACGTPVIVSDIDGLPEIAQNCGIVVHQADVDHLAKAINMFHADCLLREKLRLHCLKKYNSMLSWDEVARKWLTIFEGVQK